MRGRDIFIGFLVLVAIIAGVLWINKKVKIGKTPLSTSTPNVQQKIENKFPSLNIPADAERVELKDVSGGNSMGIATRAEILADLPELEAGQSYQAWLDNGSKRVLLGNLKIAKGGYLLEYNSSKFPGYNKIIVTLGTKTILEGSF